MQLSRHDPSDLYAQHIAPYTEAMRLAAAVSQADFDRLYVPHLLRLCRTLQQTPLSRQGYPLPDGAVRFAAHGATLALQLAQASVFAADEGAKARRDLAPQYRFAVFAALLGGAYIRVFRNVRVTVGEVAWNPLSEVPLHDACAAAGEYEIAWLPDKAFAPSPALDAMVFMAAFPSGFWERFHPMVLQDLAGGLSPARDAVSETPMQRLLRTAIERVFELESQRIAQNVGAAAAIPTLAAEPSEAPPGGATQAQPAEAAAKTPQKAATYPRLVREFFAAMCRDDKFTEMREQIKVTPDAVSVPLRFLSRYGMKATDAVQMLESAGLTRSKDKEFLVLRPEAAALLGIQEAARA